jgi:aspartyl-tRNA(Asn)/glutamyl-tRNA(Gln) amidotransferase subunit C
MSSQNITSDITSKVAGLSRLATELSPDLLQKYTSQLGDVLEYVEELQKVDTTNIQPLDGIRTCKISELRPDEPAGDPSEYARVRQNIINNFPHKQGNLLVIPGIFEE